VVECLFSNVRTWVQTTVPLNKKVGQETIHAVWLTAISFKKREAERETKKETGSLEGKIKHQNVEIDL
jgi:hypothetical protein